MIAYGPGIIKPAVVNDLVDFSDFLPTICEMAGIDVHADRLALDGRSFLPQLLGETGKPREYVYCWYSPKGVDNEARVFARTHRYKLYRNGDFIDVEQDVLEKSPLADEVLNHEQIQVKTALQAVIDKYDKIRGQ